VSVVLRATIRWLNGATMAPAFNPASAATYRSNAAIAH
jgi:hypothetical protein